MGPQGQKGCHMLIERIKICSNIELLWFILGEASFSGPKGEQGSPGLNGLRGILFLILVTVGITKILY